MKAINVKSNCIAKIKTINEIQCIKIYKNYAYVVIYLSKNAKNKIVEK